MSHENFSKEFSVHKFSLFLLPFGEENAISCQGEVRNNRLKRKFKLTSNRLHASGAVDADDLSVDPVTVLRCQEADDAGNVDGLTDTVVGRPCAGVLVDLVVAERLASRNVLAANSVVHIGLDATGGDTVDGNLLLSSVCDLSETCL